VADEREGVLTLVLQAARIEALGVVQNGVVDVTTAELAEPQPGGVRTHLQQPELRAYRAGKWRPVKWQYDERTGQHLECLVEPPAVLRRRVDFQGWLLQ
jgi:hypothetical protein